MPVKPGDVVFAGVTIAGRKVQLVLWDATDKKAFKKTLTASVLDATSAEWIVEAPSECVGNNNCTTLPLANFTTTTFVGAAATSTAGHSGAILDPSWGTTEINLVPGGRRLLTNGAVSEPNGQASPSPLNAAGNSFAVAYSPVTGPITVPPPGPGPAALSRADGDRPLASTHGACAVRRAARLIRCTDAARRPDPCLLGRTHRGGARRRHGGSRGRWRLGRQLPVRRSAFDPHGHEPHAHLDGEVEHQHDAGRDQPEPPDAVAVPARGRRDDRWRPDHEQRRSG